MRNAVFLGDKASIEKMPKNQKSCEGNSIELHLSTQELASILQTTGTVPNLDDRQLSRRCTAFENNPKFAEESVGKRI